MRSLDVSAILIGILILFGAASSVQAQEVFDARFRSALQESSGTAVSSPSEPPLGSSERMDAQTAAPATAVSSAHQQESYIDLTNGFMAAGAAMLAACIIIFLFLLVIQSRHHERT
jgi:hypothetical protein